ncbi:low-density lipoprotein receptor-related protein 6 [Nasonia vitripennis]|uniref:EGF-like domain-containing protein n=1 Tax=Nasonia vitripennis TaxID=7425 RepID=A0A7M7HA47_NASVI|nr:low-density lipoprotein receptor-related protein 6 [Nasonia vitripennis]
MNRSNSTKRISMSALSDTVLIEDEDEEADNKRKRFLGILYVPPKLEVVCSKCCCLSVTAVITICIFISTIAFLVVHKPHEFTVSCTNTAKLESSTPANYLQVILVAGADGFDYLDSNDKTLYGLPSTKKSTHLFDVYTEDTIYWVDESTWTIRSYPKEHSRIRYPKSWNITSIAADFVNEKLYLIESVSKTLKVIDVHTKFYRTLSTDYENSTDLAVDPMSGFLFVVKRSKGIFRIAMDGSVMVRIVFGNNISAITIDHKAKLIYYATDYVHIASSNYDGDPYKLLTKVSMNISSIALLGDTMFWASNTFLHFCKVKNGNCYKDKISEISLNYPSHTIRTGSHRPSMSNPCESEGAGACNEMCLLTSNQTTSTVDYVCSCRDGWQLGIDAKSGKLTGSCTKIEQPASVNYSQVILMAGTSGFGYLDLDEKNSRNLPSTNKTVNIFDVYTEDTIYWVDKSTWTIRSFPIEHSKIRYPKEWKITSIAADFVNEKLYLIESVSKSLKVIDVHTKFYRTLSTDFENSTDLAVDPMSGFLFGVKRSSGILRIAMDGSMKILILAGQDISAITIDREAKIIYYATDYASIASKNYDGGNYKLMTNVSIKILSIALLDDTIFWSTNESLYFCKLINGSCDKDNLNEISSNNIKVIRTGSHRISISNPCEKDEADGCEGLCLLTQNQTTATVDYACSCRDGWQLGVDAKSCEHLPKDVELPNLEQVITLTNNNGSMWFMNPDDISFSKPLHLPGNKETAELVSDFYHDNIFWCDSHTSTIKSLSSKYKDIRYRARWKPVALRIDYITENIYILDIKTETINCMDKEGGYYETILSDIQSPSDFALDPERGLIIVLSNKSISRATMSGRSLTTIVEIADSITSFTIDRESQRIYYAVHSKKIESINYYGTQSRALQTISSKVDGLTIFGGRLFWFDASSLSICKINNGYCGPRSYYSHANGIKAMRSLASRRNVTNPCKNKNCQQLCILDKNESSLDGICACQTGWELQSDGKLCAPVTEFMLYTRGNVIRGRILNESKTIFTEAIPPTTFVALSLKFKDTIDFDYNWITHEFIFSDDFSIFAINIMDNEVPLPQRLLTTVTKDYQIKDVAYDWKTGNIYYVQRSADNSTDHSLMVLRFDKSGEYQKTISSFTHESSYPMKACPHSLVVHSERGYLFYTAWNGERKDIQRTAADGTGLKEIGDVSYHNKYHIIAIDYEDAKLYWISDRWKTSKIWFSDMNGNNGKQIEVNQPQYPTSIYIHGKHVYIGNSVSIWRYDKVNGNKGVKMTPMIETTQVVAGVRIVGQFMQASSDAHPCVIGNGGCQQFCFAVPHKKCECKDGQHIFQERFCKY